MRVRRPLRSSLLAALATGLLAAAFLWPRSRITPWTAYAPGPPYTEVHLGPPGPWRNVVGLTTSYPLALLVGVLVAGLVVFISLMPNGRPMKRIMALGFLSALLVLGSLLLPSSVPGRSANERLEHGLPIPFIRQKLVGEGPIDEGPWAYRGPALAPQEYPTEVSEAALLADIVIVGVGLWLVGGIWDRHRRRSTSNGQVEPGRPTA
jgi:hypothetical protein